MKHFFLMSAMYFVIFPGIASAKMVAKAAPSKGELSHESLVKELTGKDEAKMSEVDLYAEIVAAYQGQDLGGLRGRVQRFVTRFPQSSFADNALYLAGRQALDRKSYTESLRYFQKISTDYPRSNRVVASQFAKAMAYKKMNLDGEARKVFRDIVVKYPGSPESYRADSEMRLLN